MDNEKLVEKWNRRADTKDEAVEDKNHENHT